MTRTRYKILPGDTHPYFITATIVNWLPLFSNPVIASLLFDSLKFMAHQSINYYLAQGNRFILDQLAMNKPTGRTDRQYKFWQEGVGPKRILNREMLLQKIENMQHNPVKRGYVDLPEHWRYSSARNYAGMAGILDVNMDW